MSSTGAGTRFAWLREFEAAADVFERHGILRTVTFFGSARNAAVKKGPLKHFLAEAETLAGQVGTEITRLGLKDVAICTGGGPGMMEAANRGATQAGIRSYGLNIHIPFEQQANPYISPDCSFHFSQFASRKHWLFAHSVVVVVFPGGVGTMDELFEFLALNRTSKLEVRNPLVVLYGTDFWHRAVDLDYLLDLQLIDAEVLEPVRYADSVEEAFPLVAARLSG